MEHEFTITTKQLMDLPILYSSSTCPFSLRVRLTLLSAGLQVKLREVDLQNKPAAMLQASPKGTVPVLVMPSGQVIDHSLDIMHWILQKQDPAGWWFELSVRRQKMACELIKQSDNEFFDLLKRYRDAKDYLELSLQAHRALASDFPRQLEERLTHADFLMGDSACIADVAIAPFVNRFADIDRDWFAQQDWPRLRAWLQRCLLAPDFAPAMYHWAPWSAGQVEPLFPAS